MNFAAFKYLANALTTWRLDRACESIACARRPTIPFPPHLIDQLLYPPEPASPEGVMYEKIIDKAKAALSGVTRSLPKDR
jgi:hypothetical protein